MRLSKLHIGFMVSLAAVGLASVCDVYPAGDSEESSESNLFEITFADRSTLKMVLLDAKIDISTRYGKLSVPISEIRAIQCALRLPVAEAKRIEQALARLASEDALDREIARKELRRQRILALPALKRATKDRDPLVAVRAKELLGKLLESQSTEKAILRLDDRVVTADFTIVGRIDQPTLQARSPYFQQTNVPLTELRSLRRLGNGEIETEITVDAAKYGQQQATWMDTGIEIESGSVFQITASGTVDVWPQDRQRQYLTGPEGKPDWGGGVPFSPARPGPPFPYAPGTLIGRIGEKGGIFSIGKKTTQAAADEGELYLLIVPSPWGNSSEGSYKVNVFREGGFDSLFEPEPEISTVPGRRTRANTPDMPEMPGMPDDPFAAPPEQKE